jgi:small-conductance mechanosensitive channel
MFFRNPGTSLAKAEGDATLRAGLEILRRIKVTFDAGAAPVHFVGVGTYSLDLEVTVYILTANDDEFARTRQELLLAILDAVEIAGTALALPTQASIEYSRMDPARPNAAAQLDERDEPVLSSRR